VPSAGDRFGFGAQKGAVRAGEKGFIGEVENGWEDDGDKL
jgi:hypothetical protein